MVERVTRFAGGAFSAGQGDGLDPRALWMALWRQRWVIATMTGLISLAAIAFVLLVTPLFRAETLIKVQASQSMALDVPDLAGRFEEDASTIESEIEFLTSNAFLSRIVDEQRLVSDQEFNPGIKSGVISPIRLLFEDQSENERAGLTLDRDAAERLATLREFKEHVRVMQVGRSYVLSVTVQSASPGKAARLANAIGEAYLIAQLEAKYDAASKATLWLSERVAELRAKVVDLEDELVRKRTSQGIFAGSRIDPLAQQIIQLNTQVAEAQARRAETEARFNQIQSILITKGGIQAASNVVSSPLLVELRAEESLLQRQQSELETIYGSKHPQIVNARAEIGSIRGKMRAEVQRILIDLENEVAVARARESELTAKLILLERNVATQEQGSVGARELEREAISARTTYERYLERLADVTEAQNLTEPDAVILSEATEPLEPAFPKKKMTVLLAFAGALVLSIGLAFLIERWNQDAGFRGSDSVFEATGLKTLSLVPLLDKELLSGGDPDHFILEKPLSVFGEALQRLRTNVYLNSDGPCRSLLITSSVPVEGKTLISASLARQSAKAGIKTLLLDADMRRPRAHAILKQPNGKGLSDVLRGKISLEEAITTDRQTGLFFLRSGHEVDSPADLCRRRTMRLLLEEVAHEFDLVVIDSPPVAAVTDSAVLSEMVDKTVYVVRFEETPRPVVLAGLKQLEDAGANLAGIVLSKVDIKKQAQYGFGEVGTYQGYYGEQRGQN